MNMANSEPKLLIVYNTGSGLLSNIADFLHMSLSPKTFRCHLWYLTHTNFGMKKEWKSFLDNIGMKYYFFTQDRFSQKHSIENAQLPAIFVKLGESVSLIATDREINRCKTFDDLTAMAKRKLNEVVHSLEGRDIL